MSSTLVRKSQIRPLNIVRSDINTTTSGSALITKIIAGTGLTLSSSTGVNPGTGDVTVALSIATASTLGGVKIGSGLTVAVDGTISVTSASVTWGSITGLLSNQNDLQAALNAKYNIPTGTTSQYIDGTGALQTFPSALATGYVRHEVKAGVPIIKGQAVYVRSSDGTNMIVELASYDAEQTSSKTMGLLDRTVSTNGFANVITEGLLAGLDTTAAQAGDPVWLGPSGNLLYGIANKPHAPFHMVFIGIVTRVNANNGEIFVKVQNGYEIDELHDVLISGAVGGQLLRRDDDGLWKNWTPNYLTSFTETDPTVPAHVKAITTTNISYWNTAYSWGNHATQGYLTSVTNISGYAGTLLREDNRTISPSELAAGQMKFGFTSWNNNNTSPYADFIHMRSYTDASGGTDNLVMFLKNGIGMRIWQQTWGSTSPYAEYVDVWTTGNFTQTNVNNWNTAYSWGNHSSQGYATQTYVNTAIANLVDAAPGTLDTLNELAAALGDDPNFATTVTNNIATKVSKSGDTMTGNLNWAQTDRGITWGFNTDGAYIKFFNTGDGDTDSRLEYATSDNGDEYHRWMISGSEEMTLKFDGLRVRDSIWMGGNLVATQSWVGSQGYITGYTESDPTVPAHVKAITTTNISNWNTAYGWGNHASVGYLTSYTETDTLATVTARGASTGTAVTFSSSANHFQGHHYFDAYDSNGNHYPHYNPGSSNNGSKLNLRMFDSGGSVVLFYLNGSTKEISWSGNTIWHAGNDGAGSGLDADLLDGQHASAFAAASHTHDDRYYTETESDARFLRYYGVNTESDFQRFQDGVGEIRFDQINDYNNLSNAPGGYNYGGVLSMRGDNFGFQIWGSHTGDLYYKTQWSGDNYTGWRSIITTLNIGSQSVNYANSAGSVAWSNVTGRPTALSQFTNDLGNYGNWITASALSGYATQSWVQSQGYLTSLPSHNHDDLYLRYAASNEPSNLAAGWYTIAVNSGNRASGKFILRDTSSGNHQSVVFYATHHFGSYSDITVLINSRYSGNPFRYIRIKDGGTYDGALLQVYLDQGSNTVRTWLLENIQANGWIVKNWVADGTNPGDLGNFAALTEIPAQVDLDYAPQGGMITTGDIYGGGDTTQYLYLNTNNYNLYSPTLTGGGASGTWGINITGSSRSLLFSGDSAKAFLDGLWAGGGSYPGYQFTGGNSRFGFSSTGGVVDVYADGNFYATDSAHLVLHAGNYTSYAVPTSRTITINGVSYDLSANRSWTVSGSDSTKLPLAGGTMSGTVVLHSISGVEQTVPNNHGAYLHLGAWGVDRTDARAVLVNTAYRADYADSLFDMNISRFTNNSGYITSSGSITGNAATATYATSATRLYASDSPYRYTDANPYYLYMNYDGGSYWELKVSPATPGTVRVAYSNNSGNSSTTSQRSFDYLYASSYLESGGAVYGTIFYDNNDRTYYLDPNSTGKALNIAGNIDLTARSASWAEGIRIRVPSTSTWGGIRFTRDRANDDGNWAIGFTGIDSSDDLTIWANNGGDGGAMKVRINKAGIVSVPKGYVSDGNPWGTSNSAFFPNGITTAGGTNWIYGSTTYIGNAPANGNGHEFWSDGSMRSTRHHYLDANYGQTIVGRYSSTVYQGVWAMGDSYKLPLDGSSTGSLYGLAWSHPNAGGVASNLNTHGLLVMENGTFLAAISGSIRARDDVRAPALYDSGSRVAISRGEGRNFVDYSRYVYNNGAYSGSGWVEPSDLGVRYASSANYATSAGSASSASSASNADRLYPLGAAIDNTHPGYGLKVWYDWAYSGTYRNGLTLGSHPSDQAYGWQIWQNMWDDRTYTRRYNGGWQSTRTLMTAQDDPYAYNMNQYVRTSDDVTFRNIYLNGWFRNNNSREGLYNQANGNHFYSRGGSEWVVTGNGGNIELQFWSNHESARRGYVYANTSNEIGFLNSGGSWSLRCDNSGNVTATGDLTAYSDARIKTNIKTYENALEKVLQLRGVTYNRTDNNDHSEKIGVIAQEIEKIIPQVVSKQEDGLLTVSYGNIVGVLIEAIKEQQKEIEVLKSKLN